jgi:Holliday junction resolvase RusA-like endonuclease
VKKAKPPEVIVLVPGNPCPWTAPRFARGRCYQTARLKAWQMRCAIAAKKAVAKRLKLTGPVSAEFIFVKGTKAKPGYACAIFRECGQRNLDGMEYDWSRPDLDNLIKSLCDGVKGIAFADDCQIVRFGMAQKVRSK